MKSSDQRAAGFANEVEIEQIVRGFEDGTLAASAFNHREHLAIACWYLARDDFDAALARVREGIKHFLRQHGEPEEVYHETVTRFWLLRVRGLLDKSGAKPASVEAANFVLTESGGSSLINEYYSRELLDSKPAREVWVEPDMRPFDF